MTLFNDVCENEFETERSPHFPMAPGTIPVPLGEPLPAIGYLAALHQ